VKGPSPRRAVRGKMRRSQLFACHGLNESNRPLRGNSCQPTSHGTTRCRRGNAAKAATALIQPYEGSNPHPPANESRYTRWVGKNLQHSYLVVAESSDFVGRLLIPTSAALASRGTRLEPWATMQRTGGVGTADLSGRKCGRRHMPPFRPRCDTRQSSGILMWMMRRHDRSRVIALALPPVNPTLRLHPHRCSPSP
jgi:hypothetical protein